MKILITSPRAPVSFEWVKIALKSGHQVTIADSFRFPISRFHQSVRYVKIPAARTDFENYKEQMLSLTKDFDMVIPNFESAFYLSKIKDSIDNEVYVYMPDYNLMHSLHNKYEVFQYINKHAKKPETKLITQYNDIDFSMHSLMKPVFSRFGRNIIKKVSPEKCSGLNISKIYPWVQQEYIEGDPLCNYALCDNGCVIAHSVYRPKYLLNGTAGSYFIPVSDKRCDNFINEFAKDIGYTGQVAFDFIDTGEDIYLIECNPRATSGLHLLGNGLIINDDKSISYKPFQPASAYRVGVGLLILFSLPSLLSGKLVELIQDYNKADDVLKSLSLRSQFMFIGEMLVRSLRYRKNIAEASTIDVEYNGLADD